MQGKGAASHFGASVKGCPLMRQYGHQGIIPIVHDHREAVCFMGAHGYRLAPYEASLLPSAPHSLRTGRHGPTWPMRQNGGAHVVITG